MVLSLHSIFKGGRFLWAMLISSPLNAENKVIPLHTCTICKWNDNIESKYKTVAGKKPWFSLSTYWSYTFQWDRVVMLQVLLMKQSPVFAFMAAPWNSIFQRFKWASLWPLLNEPLKLGSCPRSCDRPPCTMTDLLEPVLFFSGHLFYILLVWILYIVFILYTNQSDNEARQPVNLINP